MSGLDAHEQRRQGRERQQDAQPEHAAHPGVAEHSEGTPEILQHPGPFRGDPALPARLRGVRAPL